MLVRDPARNFLSIQTRLGKINQNQNPSHECSVQTQGSERRGLSIFNKIHECSNILQVTAFLATRGFLSKFSIPGVYNQRHVKTPISLRKYWVRTLPRAQNSEATKF